MKYFFEEEAKILDSVTNNLEMVPLQDMKKGERKKYVMSANDKARKILREVLSQIYRQGFEAAIEEVQKRVGGAAHGN